MELSELATAEEFLAHARAAIAAAESEVLLAVPGAVLPELAGSLAEAVADGVFVAVCLYDHPDEAAPDVAVDDVATVLRVWDVPVGLVLLHVDHEAGVVTTTGLFEDDTDETALAYEEQRLYHMAFPHFLAQQWAMGEEVHVTEPTPLPQDCENLREATVQSTLHLRADNMVGFEAEVRPAPATPDDEFQRLRGQVVTTRQNFVHPSTSEFYGEMTLIVRSAEGRVSVGGVGAVFEDYEARAITLQPLDEPITR